MLPRPFPALAPLPTRRRHWHKEQSESETSRWNAGQCWNLTPTASLLHARHRAGSRRLASIHESSRHVVLHFFTFASQPRRVTAPPREQPWCHCAVSSRSLARFLAEQLQLSRTMSDPAARARTVLAQSPPPQRMHRKQRRSLRQLRYARCLIVTSCALLALAVAVWMSTPAGCSEVRHLCALSRHGPLHLLATP